MEELLNKKEVLNILGISMNTLNLMLKNNVLPYYKLGDGQTAGVRFKKKDIEKFIKQRKVN